MIETAALTALRTDFKNMVASATYTADGTDYAASALTAEVSSAGHVLVTVTLSTTHGTITAVKLYNSASALLATQTVSISAGSSDTVIYRFTFEINEEEDE